MEDERLLKGKTDCIYEREGECYEFSATVLSCKESLEYKGQYEIILDRTAFFPEGGGQPSDAGKLEGTNLTDVKKVNGEIIHFLPVALSEGKEVFGCVDRAVRYPRMQAHMAEHLLCGIIHKQFGYDNVGFHLDTENYVTMDVDGPLTVEQIKDVERKANEAILSSIKIHPEFPDVKELEKIPFRSKLELADGIRLVYIDGYDVCACCAPTLSNTSQIGLVKVIDSMTHRGGMRLTIIAGIKAIEDYTKLDETNRNIMKQLSSKRWEGDVAVSKLSDKLNTDIKVINDLKRQITSFYLEKLSKVIGENVEGNVIYFETENLDEVQIRSLLNESVDKIDGILGIINSSEKGRNFIFASSDETKYPLRSFIKGFNEANASRGGGSDKMVQGSIPHNGEINKIYTI